MKNYNWAVLSRVYGDVTKAISSKILEFWVKRKTGDINLDAVSVRAGKKQMTHLNGKKRNI